MNRKAEVNMYVLGGIIAAIILVIILVGPVRDVLVEFGQNFFGNAPGFNQSATEPTILGLVRYDILNDKVQIYDGERWNDITKDIQPKGLSSPLSEADLNAAFETYYFNERVRTGNPLYENASLSVTAIDVANSEFIDQSIFISWFDEKIYSRGATAISIKPKAAAVLGYYFLDLDGSMKYKESTDQPKDEPLAPEVKDEVKAKAAAWRDSIFANPRINIQGQQFCLQKQGNRHISDNRYLILNLNQVGGAC